MDIKNFGKAIPQDPNNFRWAPTKEYLEELGEPLRLTAIKTKGEPNDALTAMQLVFHNSLEPPIFDSGHSEAGKEFSTV